MMQPAHSSGSQVNCEFPVTCDGIFMVTWEVLFLCATSGLEVVGNAREEVQE